MDKLEDNNATNEITRIPSPSSVSSVHSVRPLEWDSGADIGYRCKVSSNLSTVERMALVRGTVNLLETCQPTTSTKKFSTPLAHSSPFTGIAHVYDSRSSNVEKDEHVQRLVEYTIGDNESFRSVGSKSLDDLRHAVRRPDYSLARKRESLSSSNVNTTPKSSHHLSASSVVTILGSKHYSNKAVQVNERSLNESCSTSTSGIHQLTMSTNNPTYTVENDKILSTNTSNTSYNSPLSCGTTNYSQSNGSSSDRGSFEYVPGSVYDIRDTGQKSRSNSDSDVNTLCKEVIDGVELVTKYVDNLRLSNKSKVIRKIVKTLANNMNSAEFLTNKIDLNGSCNISNNCNRESRNQTKKSTNSNYLAESNSNLPSRAQTSSTDIPVTSSSISNSVSIDGISRSVSEITTANQFNMELKCRQNKSSESSTNIGPLKEFLEKERETQLLWIKSGIDHLNNLKKLYENQKLLKENLRSLRKKQTIEVTSVCKNTSQKRSPNSQSCMQQSDLSLKSQPSKNKNSSIISTETSHQSNENQFSRTSSILLSQFVTHSNKIRMQNRSKQHKRSDKFRRQCIENKENVSQNQSQSRINQTCSKLKPPVSYTVLFDTKPSFAVSQNYKINEDMRKGVHKEYSRCNTFRKKYGIFKPSGKSRSIPTLQDYLLKNKPEYINKAECRRKCLEEISKLRHLRDKSRSELLVNLHNETDKVQCIVPPPLSIIRIFDDKSMKQLTAKKYQQLPEVQNKKLALRREENYRRNQIMAKIFTKKLQKKVLKGQVNLSNTANLISN